MDENKTQQTDASVTEFLGRLEDERKRQDSLTIIELMREITQEEPKLWGPSIIGFGKHRYRYETGREDNSFLTGFSPRKANLTIYINGGFDRHAALMGRLGKHTTGKVCLYIKRLSDIDQDVLRELVQESVAFVREHSIG